MQLELWTQQSQLPRMIADKPLAAASPCDCMAPWAASPQPPRSKTSSKPVPGSASFPSSLLLPFSLESPNVALQDASSRASLRVWGRIWRFWVEAAVPELPGADSPPAQGLNHLFLGLLAKRDGFSTQPRRRRSRCHFRMAFDHWSVKPSRTSRAVSIFAFNPFQLVPGMGSAGHHLLLISFPQTLQVEL